MENCTSPLWHLWDPCGNYILDFEQHWDPWEILYNHPMAALGPLWKLFIGPWAALGPLWKLFIGPWAALGLMRKTVYSPDGSSGTHLDLFIGPWAALGPLRKTVYPPMASIGPHVKLYIRPWAALGPMRKTVHPPRGNPGTLYLHIYHPKQHHNRDPLWKRYIRPLAEPLILFTNLGKSEQCWLCVNL